MTTARLEDAPADAPRPHAAWNFRVLVADVTCFFVGLAFIDASTVLPALITRLGGGPEMIGAFAALKQAGFYLPQLLVAHRLQGRTRYLPFVLRVCLLGRAPLFAAAGALLWLATPYPLVALALLMLVYALLWLGDGAGVVPWTAIVGRAIPERQRGRFFATTQVFGGIGRIGVGLAVAPLLAGSVVPFPASGALLVLCCGVFMALSFLFLALIREPPARAERETPPLRLLDYLHTLPGHLRARPAFGRLIAAQVLASGVAAAAPFYLGFARDRLPDLPSGIAGAFLITLTLGGLCCAPLWGWLTDRYGPRLALLVLLGVGLLSPMLAASGGLLGLGIAGFYAAYFCLGAVLEGGWSIFTNYVLETIPGPEQPTYLGLMSVLNAPALVFPLAAGVLVDQAGAPAALALAALLTVAAFAVAVRLPNPRNA